MSRKPDEMAEAPSGKPDMIVIIWHCGSGGRWSQRFADFANLRWGGQGCAMRVEEFVT